MKKVKNATPIKAPCPRTDALITFPIGTAFHVSEKGEDMITLILVEPENDHPFNNPFYLRMSAALFDLVFGVDPCLPENSS